MRSERRALIVDDEEDIGLMVSRFLKSEGLEVEYVSRIAKAQSKIKEHSYEIYFLDLNLPDGTGFDLIPDIRKQDAQSKVVIISAHDGVHEINRAKSMNVDLFIKKPFTKRQVVEAIENLK